MKYIKKTIPYIFSILNIYFIFVLSFYIVLYFDKNFLINLFDKFDVYKNLPFEISKQDINKIAYELMDYLRGHRVFLDTKIQINGSLKELYSLTAKIHMSDVKNIFITNIHLASYCFLISNMILIIYSYKNKLNIILKSYIKTVIIFFIMLFSILIYALFDFSSFFELFHKMIFTNDFYLLNPNVDYIILMLPEKLFAFVGLKVFLLFILLIVTFLFFIYFFSKIQSHLEAK